MLNAMTLDVEDYYNQLAIEFCDRVEPPRPEAARDTERMLDLFAEQGVKTTCFILGEIAEYFPKVVERIGREGHQLGVHGYYHHQVWRHTPVEFRRTTERAKKLIEDVAGRPVTAHRAVAFSITDETRWALSVLAELGIQYDSSIFPFHGRRYGVADAQRRPHLIQLENGCSIWEVPPSTVCLWGRRLPACGGGYLRLFPLWYTDWAVRRLHAEGISAVFYLHPYELECSPKIEMIADLPFRQRPAYRFFNFQQVRRRTSTMPKLRYLMNRYRFGTIEQVVAQLDGGDSSTRSQQATQTAH